MRDDEEGAWRRCGCAAEGVWGEGFEYCGCECDTADSCDAFVEYGVRGCGEGGGYNKGEGVGMGQLVIDGCIFVLNTEV